jgi:DNA polymerase I-like protein with 3'-5' exonuclease and polymerase domains
MVQVSPSEIIYKAWQSEYIAVDTEGSDIKKTDLRAGTGYAYGISVACRPPGSSTIYSAYFPIAHTRDNVDETLKAQIKDLIEKHKRVVFHNAKHDILALKYMRTLEIIRNSGFYDTMLMAHFLYENLKWSGFGLDWCAKYFLGEDEGKANKGLFEHLLTLFGWTPNFPAKEMGVYAAQDAELTLRLFEKFYREFKKQGFDGGLSKVR